MIYSNVHGKRVKVCKIIKENYLGCLPFDEFNSYEKNLELSERYIGREGIAKSVILDGLLGTTYEVEFDDGKVGNFYPQELELVKRVIQC